MAKLDRDGNIIRPVAKREEPKKEQEKQPEPLPDARPQEISAADLPMVSVRDAKRGMIREREPEEYQSPVAYDFVIQCATLAPAGFDMNIVCAHCPFKATDCKNTVLLPTETQMMDIARILMQK